MNNEITEHAINSRYVQNGCLDLFWNLAIFVQLCPPEFCSFKTETYLQTNSGGLQVCLRKVVTNYSLIEVDNGIRKFAVPFTSDWYALMVWECCWLLQG